MKRLVILLALSLFTIQSRAEKDPSKYTENQNSGVYSQMGDWREGIWNRKVKENYITLDFEVSPNMVSNLKQTNAWGGGIRAGFEHKTRPSTISSNFSIGYGFHIGLSRYFGKKINVEAVGSHDKIRRDSYKSYSEIPLMLDFNYYYNFGKNSASIGLSAGVNLMLGQRDVALDYVVVEEYFGMSTDNIEFEDYTASKQKDESNVSITHVRPTGRINLGYMRELSENWRFRAQAGLEYQMKYEDKYSGYFNGSGYIEQFHEGTSKANVNPFFSVGLVYSL